MVNKLAEVVVDKKKIALYMLLRLPVLVIIIVSVIVWNAQGSNIVFNVVLLILAFTFVLSPLRHINDKLVFYENKVVFNKKELNFTNPTEIKWTIVKTYYIGKRLKIRNALKKGSWKDIFYDASELDITYMKNPKDEFVRCYFNQV